MIRVHKAWEKDGCICKVAGFGESRAALQQTATYCSTRTRNVERGTPMYMAPELFCEERALSIQELLHCDIWSLGMVYFILLNPDLQYPFDQELQCPSNKSAKKRIRSLMEKP